LRGAQSDNFGKHGFSRTGGFSGHRAGNQSSQDKLSLALQRLQEEDPSFRVRYHEETGQTLISGMGELHLEIIVDRLLREFKVEATVGKPQVAYKETIVQAITIEEIDSANRRPRQYGHVVFDMAPAERGKGIVFVDKISHGVLRGCT